MVIIQEQIVKESFCFFLIFFSEKSEKFILRTGRKLCGCFGNRCLIKRRQKGTCGEKEAALQGNNSRSIGLISSGNTCNSVSGCDAESGAETLKGLEQASGFIRRELARTINLRNTPELTFVLDTSIEYGNYMSKRIDEVIKEDQSKQNEEE